MKLLNLIPAGALFTITVGAYSDYTISGVFRAKVAIDPNVLRSAYLAKNPAQRERYRFSNAKFLVWLAQKDLLVPVECIEWHLTDYGDADEMGVNALQGESR